MKLTHYTHRKIREYVINCFRLGKRDICAPPPGTIFNWQIVGSITALSLFTMTGKRVITIAHNHTKNGDIWVGPIDATRIETANDPSIKYIKEQLERLILNKY